MKFKWMILALAVVLTAPGCFIDLDDDDGFGNCIDGSGNFVTEELDLPPFDGIVVSTTTNVFLTQGPTRQVIVEGYSNIIDRLKTNVNNGVWNIDFERCVRDIGDMKIFITIPEIRSLSITGTGDIYGENLFIVNDIELTTTGTGNMNLALEADDIDLRITGTGDIVLEGLADELRALLTGTGDLEAFDLEARFGDITVTGTGSALVFITEELIGRITGTGDIRYKGDPTVDVEDSGPGDLIHE